MNNHLAKKQIESAKMPPPTFLTNFIPKTRAITLMLMAALFWASPLKSQVCDPEADFTYTDLGDCTFDFVAATSSGTHFWQFYNNPQGAFVHSTSNLSDPLHTYPNIAGVTSRLVRHTVTINQNGQSVVKVCEKILPVTCTIPCYMNLPTYSVVDCTFTPNYDGTLTFDWGDGTPPETGQSLSHTYATSGTYTVTMTDPFTGQPCTFRIRVSCRCCNSDFDASIALNCAKLTLELDPLCEDGVHLWEFIDNCVKLINFDNDAGYQSVQITNIDTEVTDQLLIKHTFTCFNGTSSSTTKLVDVLPPGQEGIFIGIDNQTTKLTDYNCVLPGSIYLGQLTKPVYVTGIIVNDKTFTFDQTDLQFHPGFTGMDMGSSAFPLTLQNTTFARGAQGDGCELWRGFKVSGTGRFNTQTGVQISDALFGIDLFGPFGTIVNLDRTTFSQNFIGIYTKRSMGVFSMRRTIFDGGASVRPAGVLQNLANNSVLVPSLLGSSFPLYLTFNTSRGFAGIYSEVARVQLPALISSDRNQFTRLNYGILVHNADVNIIKNARFNGITSVNGYVGFRRTAGVAQFNRSGGIRKFYFEGAKNETDVPDFQNCILGIHIGAYNGTSPSEVGITKTNLDQMRTGIYLDATLSNGSVVGHADYPGIYRGVWDNKVNCTIEGATLNANGGICFFDYSNTVSDVEIYNNEVLLQNSLSVSSTNLEDPRTTGIAAVGADMLSTVEPGIHEVDIHDNRVVISGAGQSGIGLGYFPNGIIRNNAGGTFAAGNGVFATGNNFLQGIHSQRGANHRIVCNDVYVNGNAPDSRPHLLMTNSANGYYLRNKLNGRGRGIYVDEINTANIRCNEMIDNHIGLYYSNIGLTPPQGIPSVESWGNQFTNSLDLKAKNDNILFTNFWVRNIPLEFPIPNVETNVNGWFISDNIAVNCLLEGCPASEIIGLNHDQVPTLADSLIASGSISNGTFGAQNADFDLYSRLQTFPSVYQGNALLTNFVTTRQNSFIGDLYSKVQGMKEVLRPSSNISYTFSTGAQALESWYSDIAVIDNQILGTTNDATIANLLNQRNLVVNQAEAQEAVLTNIDAQVKMMRQQKLDSLVNVYQSITTTNVFESNLKTAVLVYLKHVLGENPVDSLTQIQIKQIAETCPQEGGIGVWPLRPIYWRVAGYDLQPFQCNSSSERVNFSSDSNKTSYAQVYVYPNPAKDQFMIELDKNLMSASIKMEVIDPVGKVVLSKVQKRLSDQLVVDITALSNGVYTVRLILDNGEVLTRVLIIQK